MSGLAPSPSAGRSANTVPARAIRCATFMSFLPARRGASCAALVKIRGRLSRNGPAAYISAEEARHDDRRGRPEVRGFGQDDPLLRIDRPDPAGRPDRGQIPGLCGFGRAPAPLHPPGARPRLLAGADPAAAGAPERFQANTDLSRWLAWSWAPQRGEPQPGEPVCRFESATKQRSPERPHALQRA